MTIQVQTPGVIVQEIDQGPKPIQGVGTSLTAFVGITEEASRKALDPRTGQPMLDPETGRPQIKESRLNKATLISNWTQYMEVFGSFVQGAYLPDAVYGYFANGGGPCYVSSILAVAETDEQFVRTASITIPPASGRAKCFTIHALQSGHIGNGISINVENDKAGDTFTLTVGDATYPNLTTNKGEGFIGDIQFKRVRVSVEGSGKPAPGEYALTGGGLEQLTAEAFIGNASARTGLEGLEVQDDLRLIICPDLFFGYETDPDSVKERARQVQRKMVDHCERLRYRFALLDTPPGLDAQEALNWQKELLMDSSYAALYYPWVEVADFENGTTKMVPPSGHVVGLYNRIDAQRGVHKAPGNEVLNGVVGLEYDLTAAEQGELNQVGVNCIRAFAGRGIRVWGVRTLSSDTAWRYINVRRLFIYISASLDRGLQWVVFEPNNRDLWAKVRRDVRAFLRNTWLSGALFGNTPEEAYYVKCDQELNSQTIRDLGQLIVEVGVAPVKPAEFVIVRLSQWAGPNAEE